MSEGRVFKNTSGQIQILCAGLGQHLKDICLVCSKGHKIYAHKLLLCSASPTIKQILLDCPDYGLTTVHVPDVSYELLTHLIDLLYAGGTLILNDSYHEFKDLMKFLGIEIPIKENIILMDNCVPYKKNTTENEQVLQNNHRQCEEECVIMNNEKETQLKNKVNSREGLPFNKLRQHKNAPILNDDCVPRPSNFQENIELSLNESKVRIGDLDQILINRHRNTIIHPVSSHPNTQSKGSALIENKTDEENDINMGNLLPAPSMLNGKEKHAALQGNQTHCNTLRGSKYSGDPVESNSHERGRSILKKSVLNNKRMQEKEIWAICNSEHENSSPKKIKKMKLMRIG